MTPLRVCFVCWTTRYRGAKKMYVYRLAGDGDIVRKSVMKKTSEIRKKRKVKYLGVDGHACRDGDAVGCLGPAVVRLILRDDGEKDRLHVVGGVLVGGGLAGAGDGEGIGGVGGSCAAVVAALHADDGSGR